MALSRQGKVDLKKELDKRNYYELTERERVAIEERNKSRNLIRLLQTQRKEQEEADQQQSAKERDAYRERSLEQEETLARELDELRRKEICAIRERQRLRENSHELKELETKLRAAYTKRELRAQMAENEEKRRKEKLHTIENNKTLEEARVQEHEYSKYLKQLDINKKHEYKMELQDQMIFKEKMKRYKYEEFLKEKKLVDQVVERIHLEDERALQEKWLKMQKTKAEMESFKKSQEIWKERQRKQVELENKKIQEYMFSKQTDLQAKQKQKEEQEKKREEMVDKIAKRLYEEKTKQRERENIQQELLEQEQLEAAELREQNEIAKNFRQRMELIKGLDSQVAEHELRRKAIAEEDAFYKEMMQKNADDNAKLDMLTSEKRRIKKMQLRRDLQDLIAERRKKHAENMQILLKLHEQELAELAERNQKIEEERISLLKEHAVHLIGYMPKGILREEDLPFLGDHVQEKYKPKRKN
ncbi:hypothetical protein HHI36_016497 [Cryptolaemus montrouzieri]|uniref:Meiosis-specific nuclear structural protein 1 n=1 Tax=Cryptolaemus montrouzieri TaxID=559131 RepID=A0ABD2NKA5_9CUCU